MIVVCPNQGGIVDTIFLRWTLSEVERYYEEKSLYLNEVFFKPTLTNSR